MSVSSDLTIIAPQFDSVVGRSRFIEIATNRVNRCLFGDKADWATALMTAHMITLSTSGTRSGGEAGSIASKKEGDLSIGYGASGGGGNSDLGLTHWGQQFLGLSQGNTVHVGVTGGNDDGCNC